MNQINFQHSIRKNILQLKPKESFFNTNEQNKRLLGLYNNNLLSHNKIVSKMYQKVNINGLDSNYCTSSVRYSF